MYTQPFATGGTPLLRVASARVSILGRAEALIARCEARHVSTQLGESNPGDYVLLLCTKAQDAGSSTAGALQAGESILYQGTSDPAGTFAEADCIVVRFTQAALDAVSDDANATRITGLIDTGIALRDERIVAIGISMACDLNALTPSSGLFLTSLTLALLTHIAVRYGGIEPLDQVCKGGLAPWQVRRAQERMIADLGLEIDISAVARDCGLSKSHFSRAFRNTVGEPPHTWLVRRRVEAAKRMMSSCDDALAAVALTCGFADQSHFTRAFTREVGTSPGLWRRCLARDASAFRECHV